MELVALSDRQLRALAFSDPELKRVFQGIYPSDRLPERPPKTTRGAYIVNTDPAGQPGQHWLGLWTDQGVCEVTDSYGLPLTAYDAPGLHKWIAKHWKYVVRTDRTLQAYDSRACGHYAFAYLQDRVRGRSLLEFVETTTITCGTIIAWGNASVLGSRPNWTKPPWTNPMDRIRNAVSLDVVCCLH